jgi:hypothetical protein
LAQKARLARYDDTTNQIGGKRVKRYVKKSERDNYAVKSQTSGPKENQCRFFVYPCVVKRLFVLNLHAFRLHGIM